MSNLKEWLRSAAKHGLADESTATVMSLYRLREKKTRSQWLFNADGAKQNHPFSLATIGALWTREGTPPLADQFSLVLAFARDPSVPPCLRLPGAEAMAYLSTEETIQRHLGTPLQLRKSTRQ